MRLKEVADVPGGVGEFFWPGVSGCNFWVDPKAELIAVFLTHAPDYRTEHRIGLKRAVYAGLKQTHSKHPQYTDKKQHTQHKVNWSDPQAPTPGTYQN